jgi:hypothetical protein
VPTITPILAPLGNRGRSEWVDNSDVPVEGRVLVGARVPIKVGVSVGVGVPVGVGTIVGVQTGTGVRVAVGMSTSVGVGVTIGKTVGVASRVGLLAGIESGTSAIPKGVFVTVGVPVDVTSGVGVLVEGVVHQGAVKEKPSNTQVRLPPPLQVVWKTLSCRPGWKSVPCPRS